MTLNGKRVVVLGGSSGIGLATAEAAAREGAKLVIASSHQARVDKALVTLPVGSEGYALDLTDENAVRVLFERLGSFDHMAFTAGDALQMGALAGSDLQTSRRFFDLRYWGAFLAAKHGSRNIRPGGSIVFTSGTASARPMAGWAVGASVTAAMEGLTRALAVELAPVRVNIVCPGVVRTPLWDSLPKADQEALFQQLAAKLPVRHIGEPQEVAEAYLYLMRQTYATGQTIVVDGGGVLV